jgi:hypothetical protein
VLGARLVGSQFPILYYLIYSRAHLAQALLCLGCTLEQEEYFLVH